MPAIQPIRLKRQITLVTAQFDNPQNFLIEIHGLLSYYSNPLHHPGQSGEPAPLMNSYNVPKPVLRHIQKALIPFASNSPNQALALSQTLWSEPYLETHLLAAFMVGQIPSDQATDTIQQIQQWVLGGIDERFLKPLAEASLQRLRQEDPSLLIHQIEIWLEEPNLILRQFAFQALIPIISDPCFENLPLIINLINPYTRTIDEALRQEILDIILALINRSPIEIAYLLRKNYQVFKKDDTAWLIRQSISRFPADLQQSLKETIRMNGNK
jgi:hypothetical protein